MCSGEVEESEAECVGVVVVAFDYVRPLILGWEAPKLVGSSL